MTEARQDFGVSWITEQGQTAEEPKPKGAENNGGEGGIRTHGRISPTHAFQACSLNRSDTSPEYVDNLAESSETRMRRGALRDFPQTRRRACKTRRGWPGAHARIEQ
jgi:hypothetical protein